MLRLKFIRAGVALIVGMLATATAASAAVVYSGPITGATTANGYPNMHIGWDMESSIFTLGWYPASNPFIVRQLDDQGMGDIIPSNNWSCMVLAVSQGRNLAAKLSYDAAIGASNPWVGWGYLEEWSNGDRGYVGLTYISNTNVPHYGWVDVGRDNNNYSVYGWAYEDCPNTAIAAGNTGASAVPEPGSIAVLLSGITGSAFAMWRKRK